jgi:hypothetical protein
MNKDQKIKELEMELEELQKENRIKELEREIERLKNPLPPSPTEPINPYKPFYYPSSPQPYHNPFPSDYIVWC